MRASDRLDHFKKQIRRQQIDSMFAAKRIKMLQQFNKTVKAKDENGMECEGEKEEVITIANVESITLDQLKSIAKFSQTQSGIQSIHKAKYEPYMVKFFGEKYLATDEQFYASYIVGNLYFLPVVAPTEQLTRQIVVLMEEAEMRTVENMFSILSNVITDYPDWFIIFFNQHQFGEILIRLFARFEQPSTSYMSHLTQLLLKVLHKMGRQPSFLKMSKFLTYFILLKETVQRKELLKKSVFCYYFLLKMYTKQLIPNVMASCMLPRLIQLVPFFNQNKIVQIVLEIIQLVLFQLQKQELQIIIVPFLVQLAVIRYELGDKSTVYTPRQLKIQTYQLVYRIMSNHKLQTNYVSSTKLGEIMLQDFSTCDDKQILIELTYIFVQIYLNSDSQQLKASITHLIQRSKTINANNYEFEVFLHQFYTSI